MISRWNVTLILRTPKDKILDKILNHILLNKCFFPSIFDKETMHVKQIYTCEAIF